MNTLRLQLRPERTTFEPGEEIAGDVWWQLDAPPRAMELRLFWFTRGKGTEDVGVAETVRFDHPQTDESRSFRFRLPAAPYSFSGQLITLSWALELVAEPSRDVARQEITVAPGGREVRLESVPDDGLKSRFFLRRKS